MQQRPQRRESVKKRPLQPLPVVVKSVRPDTEQVDEDFPEQPPELEPVCQKIKQPKQKEREEVVRGLNSPFDQDDDEQRQLNDDRKRRLGQLDVMEELPKRPRNLHKEKLWKLMCKTKK